MQNQNNLTFEEFCDSYYCDSPAERDDGKTAGNNNVPVNARAQTGGAKMQDNSRTPAPDHDSGIPNYTLSDGTVITNGRLSYVFYFLRNNRVEDSPTYTPDEIGMASLFVSLYGKDWFRSRETGAWYRWDDNNWVICRGDEEIRAQLMEMFSILKLYALDLKAQGMKVAPFIAFIRTMCTSAKIRSVESILELKLSVYAREMDGEPYIINTPARAYDLKNGKTVTDFMKKDSRLTLSTAVNPAGSKVRCDAWDKFIDEIMSGDEEKKSFLQRALGYSLLGDNREECMFIAYGPKTRNGKGTLFTAVMNAVGHEYGCSAPADLICGGKKPLDVNAPSPLLAGFAGKRLLTMSETGREIRLNSALIKTLTGRDEISARGLYGMPFTYIPQFTMWLSTNFLPEIDDPSVFASDRIRVIEFNEHFGDDRQNKDLKRLFTTKAAASYIMAWLLHGAIDYIVNGLNPPACVTEATKKYAQHSDTIGRFIADKCVTGSDRRVLRPYLYRVYKNWCAGEDTNMIPLSAKALCIEMANRGYNPVKSHGEYYLEGLELRIGDYETDRQ